MTEKWKSNPMHWCDYCKVWMQDNPSSRATHERGEKHQNMVARKLRGMRQKADSQKREHAMAEASMSKLEEEARKQYEQDMKAAQDAHEGTYGSWVPDKDTGYLYNAKQRYYYSREAGMYYGGDPSEWTSNPTMPAEAHYNDPDGKPAGQQSGSKSKPGGFSAAAGKAQPAVRLVQSIQELGGYSMPNVGTLGAARGAGDASKASLPQKRKAPASQTSKSPATKEEAAELARREAARTRVEKRTMQSFGMQPAR